MAVSAPVAEIKGWRQFKAGKRAKPASVDRDTKFSEAFRITLEEGGVEPVPLPPRSPNLSQHLVFLPYGISANGTSNETSRG